MKKLQTLLIVPATLLLVACSKSPKDEFLSLMKEQQKQDKASYDYTIKVDDASGELFAQLEPFKGKEIKATASQDLKKELVGLTVDLSDFDSSFSDFEMIYSGDKAYMNAAPFAQFAQISGGATEELDDKFLDIEEFSGEDMPSLGLLSSESSSNTEILEDLDAKHFTKDGNNISVTITIDELIDLSAKASKKMTKGDEKKVAEQLKTYTDLAKASLDDKSKFVITVDGKGNGTAKVQLKTAAGLGESSEIKATLSYKKTKYKQPNVPKKSDLLTKEEFTNVLTDAASTGGVTLPDEDFNELYAALEVEAPSATKEEIRAYIDAMKDYLSPEQVKKLEGLLQKASDA